jgi:hypothetical protein
VPGIDDSTSPIISLLILEIHRPPNAHGGRIALLCVANQPNYKRTSSMPTLADDLIVAGCDNEEIVNHG